MTPEEAAIRKANQLFYQALTEADLPLMASLWLHENWTKCTHPGWEVLLGWPEIYASWSEIFSHDYRLSFVLEEMDIQIVGAFASVSCIESVTIFDDESDAFTLVQMSASKLFQWHEENWLLIHHHTTPMPVMTPQLTSELIQ